MSNNSVWVPSRSGDRRCSKCCHLQPSVTLGFLCTGPPVRSGTVTHVSVQVSLLQQRISRNAFDTEAWELLVEELEAVKSHPGMQEKLKSTLESIIAQYPTAVRHTLPLI